MNWTVQVGIIIILACDLARSSVIKVKRNTELIDLIAQETRQDDLVADEATGLAQAREQSLDKTGELKYSARYQSKSGNKIRLTTEVQYGTRTTPRKEQQQVLDFRIPDNSTRSKVKPNQTVTRRKIVKYIRTPVIVSNTTESDLKVAEAGSGKSKKEVESKKDDDDEKTLSQQVADGKYGLIQNEIFPNGSKRPGIISYLPNDEVPSDTRHTLGGLDKDEIWLAEDHVLVLKGGRYSDSKNNTDVWPPIDDYIAPPRQVKIPKRPKVPPPFPVQLTDDGPLEFVKGINGTGGPPRFPFLPGPPPGSGLPFPGQGLPYPPPNGSFPYPPPNIFNPVSNITLPFPPNRPLPPFLANLPPGAAFLPPPGNITDFDEDDPSIYYPPPYDFYYPRDNSTDVPPGPLVPGIILPPPPNFFAPLKNDTGYGYGDDHYEDNETDDEEAPYKAPVYLPVPRKPTIKYRPVKRPYTTLSPAHQELSNQIKDSTRQDMQSTTPITNVHLVYPQKSKQELGMAAPIYVPSTGKTPFYHPLPTTSPKPNHITLPKSETLKKILPQEIYVVSKTIPAEKNKTRIETKYENISPDVHPFRSLIKPNVTVSYIGKYGHLPAGVNTTDISVGGHYITSAPRPVYIKQNVKENEIISVTPVPVRVNIKPITISPTTTSQTPSKATFYFYEEADKQSNKQLPGILKTGDKNVNEFVTPKPVDIPGKTEDHTIGYFSTSKTPIRQFLEETFHSSNVLPNKPQPSHYVVPNGYEPAFYHEIPTNHKLSYPNAPPGVKQQMLKYHYVTEAPIQVGQTPTKTVLEIENAGSSGIQKIKTQEEQKKPEVSTVVVPTSYSPPVNQPIYTVETKPPLDYRYTTPRPDDGPFIPSNYYATANPQDLYLTPHDHTIVDDITKNYFTIFGQKITSPTTPLTPTVSHNIIDTTNTFGYDKPITKLPQKTRRPGKTMRPSLIDIYTTEKPYTTATRPKSNFEQYLKEITGEDQRDYVEMVPLRLKKPKANLGFIGKQNYQPGLNYNPVSMYLNPPNPQYVIEVSTALPQLKHSYREPQPINYKYVAPEYIPSYSTTARPTTVEIEPQYVQHISSTSRPLVTKPNHDFRQFLQEISTYTSPTTLRPVRIKNPTQYNVQYTRQQQQQQPKPISLESDILVNYKQPLPQVNPESESINPPEVTSNFKIVQPPDLTRQKPKQIRQQQNIRTNKLLLDVPPMTNVRAKEFFQNLPNSGYFNPLDNNYGNSFISYNLPGNGGHFYFLTPQAIDRRNDNESSDNNSHSISNNGEDNTPLRYRDRQRTRIDQINEEYPLHSYSNQDYLRRRRKKTKK